MTITINKIKKECHSLWHIRYVWSFLSLSRESDPCDPMFTYEKNIWEFPTDIMKHVNSDKHLHNTFTVVKRLHLLAIQSTLATVILAWKHWFHFVNHFHLLNLSWNVLEFLSDERSELMSGCLNVTDIDSIYYSEIKQRLNICLFYGFTVKGREMPS